uniref:ATP synthase F0 subunit 8 n=1 Tax=Euphyllodromia sp. Z257 TaxID=2093493 RepID=A0A2P1HA09_9NEOP|nr:ATP synthase F0 subunit 8 [Euphyllodromia sp. Z257]
MPQMMPMSWLMLFIYFSILIIMFNYLNYYIQIKYPSKTIFNMKLMKVMKWKW